MESRRSRGGAADTAWLALAGASVAAVAAAALPGLRPVLVVAAAWGAVLLVLAGVRLNRPRPSGLWLLVALMLACWAVGFTDVQVTGRNSPFSVLAISAGQAVATVATIRLVNPQGRHGRPSSPLDVLVIATVLALVVLQIVAGTASDRGSVLVDVVVPAVDVAILGLLVRFAVSRRGLSTASYLLLLASLGAIVCDLLAAVSGVRVALPGAPDQVLCVLALMLFAVAALHPTMVSTFDVTVRSSLRRPSTSLLGLLPLVAVPLALWWVARVTGASGLPTWAFLVVGAVVAALCLLRASLALRASEHLADHDPLTDLPNRRGLARAFVRNAPPGGWSVLLLDVDEFKQVNDTHGHEVGDRLLLQVRDRLLEAAGRDGLVARLGGDEFVLLVAPAAAQAVAERALAALRAPVAVGDLRLRTSASIGIADVSGVGGAPTLTEVLTCADVAMYAAKAAGRDTCVAYRPHMRVDVAHRFALTGQVRQLLGGESAGVGHLEVHYQPLVELVTGEVVGAEALVRWRHPEHGLMAPDGFLGLVSSCGLDDRLDRAVLREVLLQQSRWQDQGRRSLPVSVNLTRASLLDPALAGRVLDAVAMAGVPAACLHLEITEHEELPEGAGVEENLAILRRRGIGVSIDDYGTGYTSLDYLRRFRVEVLKLDRSVVTSVDEDGASLVAGLAAMARTLAVDVLAEGVETVEQRRRLVELGVRFGQGYLFSRALPPAEYAEAVLGPAVVHDVASVLPAPRLPVEDGRPSLRV